MTTANAETKNEQSPASIRKAGWQYTKIVATVGPACSSYENLKALTIAGVDVFRLNFSHGSHEDHKAVIDNICALNDELKTHVAILADLQGPKLRVGKIKDNALPLKQGDIITLVNENVLGTMEKIYMSYEQFAEDCNVGERIMMDDGKLVFEVVETNKTDTVRLKCLHDGVLSSNKGVNLPDTQVKLPALTEKDIEDLNFILTQPVNWIALSFVRKEADVMDLTDRIIAAGHPAKVISKIEKPEAMVNLREIIKASNGIMVARGDLGVEMPIEQLPITQKEIIQMCMQFSRPVIVATQMMDSMIVNPSPTRAEITDVANAVFDGADAVMLSGETSVGAYPILCVEAMTRIIREAEKHYWPQIESKRPRAVVKSKLFLSDVVCFNACRVAEELGAVGIVGMTSSGYTAFKVSSFRPNAHIYIFSDQTHMLNTLNLVWGVSCFHYDSYSSTDDSMQDVVDILKRYNYTQPGDIIINTGSMPIHRRFRTNMLKVTIVE
jgi:pyruvate kinase